MINNYLDFVKGERKYLLKASKARFRDFTGVTDEWLRGYDRGWSCAQLCASWRWRKLQKDIEARHRNNERLASVGLITQSIYQRLS